MNPEEFIRTLKKNVPPLTVCTGEEIFFKEEIYQEIRRALERESPGFQVIHWEAQPGEETDAEIRRLLSELETPSLFNPVKLVLLRHGRALLKERAKDLLGFLESGPAGAHLCIFAGTIDGRTSLARKLNKNGTLVKCPKLYDQPYYHSRHPGSDISQVEKWALGRAKKRGIAIEKKAVEFLTTLTGNNLFVLDSELEKLELASKEGKTAGVADVEEATGMSALHTPFDLWNRIEKGSVHKAMETLGVILRNGLRSRDGKLVTDPPGIAAILLKIFRDRIRLAAQVFVLQGKGRKENEIRKITGLSSPFYFNKIRDYARRLTAKKYPLLKQAVFDAERRIKREGWMAAPVLEEAVVRLARINSTDTSGKKP